MLNPEDKLIGTEDKANFAYRFTFFETEARGGLFTIERLVVLRETISLVLSKGERLSGDITEFVALVGENRITNGFVSDIVEYNSSLKEVFDLLNGRNQMIWKRDEKTLSRFDGEECEREIFVPIACCSLIFAIAYTANKKKHYGFN